MKRTLLIILIITTVVVIVSCELFNGESASPPTITSQGFRIETIQEGEVGQFGSLRLRIESPAGIQNLKIKERSYDIDLASTPERAHFKLFDLDLKILSKKDVTLDFKNYINQKLQQEGDYTFTIEVNDDHNQATKATIHVRLMELPNEPESTQAESTLSEKETSQLNSEVVKKTRFEVQRIGSSEIEGAVTFGLTWKTIDTNQVKIRIRTKDDKTRKLVRLDRSDYDNIVTENDLKEALEFAKEQQYIDINTTNNAAAGEVLGMVNLDRSYAIKISQSKAVFSDAGTIVILAGEYKY